MYILLLGILIIAIVFLFANQKNDNHRTIYTDFRGNVFDERDPRYRNSLSGTGINTFSMVVPRPPTFQPTIYSTPNEYLDYVDDSQLYDYYQMQSLNFPKIPYDQFKSYANYVPLGI